MTQQQPIKLYGAVRELFRFTKWPRGQYQCLLEGPAGTGKTRGLLEWVHYMCDTHPGIRVLFLRRTKESLAESVLDTWENHVLWPGHPCIVGQAQRNARQHYTFPNGSHVVLGGLKDRAQAEKTFSTQYDIIIFFEAREIPDINMWHWLARANRNYKIPWQLRIADTNPGAEFHWLNQYFPRTEDGGAFRKIPKRMYQAPPYTVHCDERHVNVIPRPEDIKIDADGHIELECPTCAGKAKGASMFRLLSRFRDNPVWWDHAHNRYTHDGLEYIEGSLAMLTGAPWANLYEGRWTSEEGVILEEWDPAVHIVDPEDAPEKYDWYFGVFDKGLRHPGCLQVWGVVGDSMWRVYEMYRSGENIDWWADQVEQVHKRYGLQALCVDPKEAEYIDRFNDCMGEARGKDGDRIARRAMNSILTGISLVRYGLSKRNNGPRIFVVRGSLQGKDSKRVSKLKPACLEEEIGSWVWIVAEDGKVKREIPDPTCADHAMDCLRYAAMFMWNRDMTPPKEAHVYDPWSYGDVLSHGEVLDSLYR